MLIKAFAGILAMVIGACGLWDKSQLDVEPSKSAGERLQKEKFGKILEYGSWIIIAIGLAISVTFLYLYFQDSILDEFE